MTAVLLPLGLLLVLATLLDLIWTTLAAGSGAGPLTNRTTARCWQLLLRLHRRWRSHRLLSAGGVSIALLALLTWIFLLFVAWCLVFGVAPGAVRVSATGAPASFVDRIYYVGYTLFTLGNGDLQPGSGGWKLLTVAATGTGLVLVTLAITYLVPVAGAVASRRQLASHISAMGADPHEIVTRAWDGSGFGSSLSQHLTDLTSSIQATRQQHFTYPVLHYFHSGDIESAAGPNLANLSDALLLLGHGVAPDARPDLAAVRILDRSIGSFLETLDATHLPAGREQRPPPRLAPLAEAGIPVVDEATFAAAVGATAAAERRRLLAALLRDDGWPPGFVRAGPRQTWSSAK